MISGNLFPHVRDDPAEHARPNNEKIAMPDAVGRERTDLCISGRACEHAMVGINKDARTVPEKHAACRGYDKKMENSSCELEEERARTNRAGGGGVGCCHRGAAARAGDAEPGCNRSGARGKEGGGSKGTETGGWGTGSGYLVMGTRGPNHADGVTLRERQVGKLSSGVENEGRGEGTGRRTM
jgi:hypothetical protein